MRTSSLTQAVFGWMDDSATFGSPRPHFSNVTLSRAAKYFQDKPR